MPMRSSRQGPLGPLVNAALVGLAFALLAVVLWQDRAQAREVLGRGVDPGMLGLVLLISQLGLLITFFRWHLLVRVVEPGFTLRATMLLGFVGYVFNLVLPGAVGGDLIKASYLSRMHIRKTRAIATLVIDRVLGLLGLFVLAAIAGVLAWGAAAPGVRGLILSAWAALGLGIVGLVAVLARVPPRPLVGPVASGHGRLAMLRSELGAMAATYRRRLDVVLAGLALSVLGHGLSVLVFFLIGRMLLSSRMTASLGEHFLMVPLTLFTMAVPLPLGALGVTEEVGRQLFKLVGHAGGSLAMIGLRLVMFVLGLEGACVYLANLDLVRALTRSAHHPDGRRRADDGRGRRRQVSSG